MKRANTNQNRKENSNIPHQLLIRIKWSTKKGNKPDNPRERPNKKRVLDQIRRRGGGNTRLSVVKFLLGGLPPSKRLVFEIGEAVSLGELKSGPPRSRDGYFRNPGAGSEPTTQPTHVSTKKIPRTNKCPEQKSKTIKLLPRRCSLSLSQRNLLIKNSQNRLLIRMNQNR